MGEEKRDFEGRQGVWRRRKDENGDCAALSWMVLQFRTQARLRSSERLPFLVALLPLDATPMAPTYRGAPCSNTTDSYICLLYIRAMTLFT
jgi:hypothetical protein